MSQQFEAGDFLIFQLEAGYALLKILAIDGDGDERVWHLAAYEDLFMDVDSADDAISNNAALLKLGNPHLALTTRAFLSTQVARMGNAGVSDEERERVSAWRLDPTSHASDRSVRLLLGLR
ncbi:MAG: hypothetical protein ACK4S4_13585 [Pyrinomonadaceae bacterium]